MDKLIMSKKEIEQVCILKRVENGEITQNQAAKMLGFGERNIRKKLKRFRLEGAPGIIHKNRGKSSKRRWNRDQEAFAMRLFENEFKGFGPTFAAEKLYELYGIKISRETMRSSMKKHGFWFIKTPRPKYRKRRERKPCIGLMKQLDGTPHDWFEGRAPKCTLLVFIDDATSKLMWLEFAKSESVESMMIATKKYIEKYGRPISFYVDYGSVFSVNINNAEHDKITQFERACKELGIEVIHAGSPQAKGRVERSNKTLQDRLIKEMRLRNICSIEDANKFAQNEYMHLHNAKFARPSKDPGDAHRPVKNYKLENIFCLKEKRLVQNDFTISYKKRLLQLSKYQKTIIRPKDYVTISEQFDGKLKLSIRATWLDFEEIKSKPRYRLPFIQSKQFKSYKPAPNHPWRRYACKYAQNI